MNLEQAKQLKRGDILVPNVNHVNQFHNKGRNKDGSWMRFRITSIKTWKRDTNRILIGLQRGLYAHMKINESELIYFDK